MRIGQLFSNLLGNALAYGPPGEPVTVTRKRKINSRWPCAMRAIRFRPPPWSGCSLPFSRGEVRPSQQGLGLGLYIASEIAKAHGGSIDVTSTPELTCFTLRMPLMR